MIRIRKHIPLSAGLLFCACSPAAAQGISINYDRLASLEEPLATNIGEVTLNLTGLLDAPVSFDLQPNSEDDINPAFIGNFELTASSQLTNRWNVSLQYFGQYQSDIGSILDVGGAAAPDRYTDNVAGFISGAWGSLVGGNTTNLVREETRRLRGAGNGALAFDNNLAQMGDWGGGYVGQFGPARLSFVVDGNGDFDVGASWSRPIGTKDYRFAVRYASGDYISADATTTFTSDAALAVGEFIYGSGLYDLGVGYERLSANGVDLDRWFASAGARYKIGAWTASVEGHYGETENQREISGALGIQFDIARGLSANLGLNHADAQVTAGPIQVISRKATEGIFSLRYSF
ncbi:MAG: hypothetical protein AAGA36_03195 [Pseudomonadota bacterium]